MSCHTHHQSNRCRHEPVTAFSNDPMSLILQSTYSLRNLPHEKEQTHQELNLQPEKEPQICSIHIDTHHGTSLQQSLAASHKSLATP